MLVVGCRNGIVVGHTVVVVGHIVGDGRSSSHRLCVAVVWDAFLVDACARCCQSLVVETGLVAVVVGGSIDLGDIASLAVVVQALAVVA